MQEPLLDPVTLAMLQYNRKENTCSNAYEKGVAELHDYRLNFHKAKEFLEEAHNAGDKRASYVLGVWYYLGLHKEFGQSKKRGASYLKEAAASGIPEACYYYAQILESGDGVQKNTRNAFKYRLRAALLGYVDAFYDVALHYEKGVGVKKDQQIAYIWRGRGNELYEALLEKVEQKSAEIGGNVFQKVVPVKYNKNIQVIDGADNCTFSIYEATSRNFSLIFPDEGQDLQFSHEIPENEELSEALSALWARPILKKDAKGIHGTLFYDYQKKRQYFPNNNSYVCIDRNSVNVHERDLLDQELRKPKL